MSGPTIAKALPSAKQVLANLEERGFREVVEALAVELRAPIFLLCGRPRFASVVRARYDVWTALRAHGLSSKEIGAIFGVDHTSVLYGTGSLSRKPRGWARRQKAKAS